MSAFFETVLKRKWFFIFFFVLGVGATLSAIRFRERIYEGEAVLRILEQKTGDGTSLLISQTKGIINPLVMEKAVLKLGWARPEDPAEKLQKKILELQKSLRVVPEDASGIVHIRVRRLSGSEAVQAVNAFADAFETISRQEAGAEARQFQDYLDRQMTSARQKTSELEGKIEIVEKNTPPPDVAEGLERDLNKANEKRQNLLKVFTSKHPEVVKLDEEIAHLERDLAALPKPEGNLQLLKEELTETQNAFRSFSEQRQDAIFKQAEETGNVRILRRAASWKPAKKPFQITDFLSGVFIGLLAGLAAAMGTEFLRF